MKKYNVIYLMMIALLTAGCEDFLEEQPKDEIALDQYFTAPEHARDAVNALYRTGAMDLYPGGVYSGAPIMFGPYITGFVDNDYKGQEVHVGYAQELTYNEGNLSTYFNNMWSNMYLGISRANTAIKYIPGIEELSEEASAQYMAEARFFRALNYFYLVRLFGGVPLITEPYESIGNLEMERSSLEAVYDLIVEDLKFGIDSGALNSGTILSNNGRITEEVAQTVLADVYLTMSGEAVRGSGEAVEGDYYAEAADAARAVINSGIYALIQHTFNEEGELVEEESAYNKIRMSTRPESEYIYYYEHQIGIDDSPYPSYSYPVSVSQDLAYSIVNNAYGPTDPLLNSYNPLKDLRIQEKQFFHSSDVLPSGEEIEFAVSPHIWKDEIALYETAQSEKATAIYTYSNVLLMAAEAIVKSEGVTSEAVEYLASVRERAYWQEDPAAIRTDLMSLSSQEFLEEVWKERLRELIFEFTVWFDVLRTGKFPVPAADGSGEIEFVDVVGATNAFGGTITETDLLLPIPELELQRNPALTQNPGY